MSQFVLQKVPAVPPSGIRCFLGIAATLGYPNSPTGAAMNCERRRRLIVDGLNSIGLACFEPRGAFYVFPPVAGTGMTDEAFFERLLVEVLEEL